MNQSLSRDFSLAPAQVVTFNSLCTVQQATNTPDSVGQVDLTGSGFVNIAGVVNVQCMRAPASSARIIASEMKLPNVTEALNVFHVLLDGWFPQIPEAIQSRAQLRALIDGVPHEVMAVESFSQKTLTRMMCRQVGV